MRRLVRWMDRVLYPQYEDNWDNRLFREEVLKLIRPDFEVLDLGAGAGYVTEMNFRGQVARMYGVDPDERVLDNSFLDEAVVGMSEAIPYPDNKFDLVFANNVLEHLEHPEVTLKEVSRVLKAGGLFLAKTPNRRHYVPLIARCLPHSMHQLVNRLRGRESVETFPTHYRLNTPTQVRRLAGRAGLKPVRFALVEGRPEYLRIFPPFYLLGWVYERWVNCVPGFARYRVILITVLGKVA